MSVIYAACRRQQSRHAHHFFGATEVKVDDERCSTSRKHQLQSFLIVAASQKFDAHVAERPSQHLHGRLVAAQYGGRLLHALKLQSRRGFRKVTGVIAKRVTVDG